MRSRRVLLKARWWRRAGAPMTARVVERGGLPRTRPPRLSPELAAGTGWVALVPDLTGYRMRATNEDGKVVEWRVNDAVASRLSPFAFTFFRRFEKRALVSRDMQRFPMLPGRPH